MSRGEYVVAFPDAPYNVLFPDACVHALQPIVESSANFSNLVDVPTTIRTVQTARPATTTAPLRTLNHRSLYLSWRRPAILLLHCFGCTPAPWIIATLFLDTRTTAPRNALTTQLSLVPRGVLPASADDSCLLSPKIRPEKTGDVIPLGSRNNAVKAPPDEFIPASE